MASGYDISASASSGISASTPFYNNAGISFGKSSQQGGGGDSSGGTVVATASRQQAGGNQAIPDSQALQSYYANSANVPMGGGTNWLPWIIGGGVLIVGVILFFVLRKK